MFINRMTELLALFPRYWLCGLSPCRCLLEPELNKVFNLLLFIQILIFSSSTLDSVRVVQVNGCLVVQKLSGKAPPKMPLSAFFDYNITTLGDK